MRAAARDPSRFRSGRGGRVVAAVAVAYYLFTQVLDLESLLEHVAKALGPWTYLLVGFFAFAEGAEPLRLFWQKADRYFCRQLTWPETQTFCRLAAIPLPW